MSVVINEPWWPESRNERYRIRLLTQKEATINADLDGVAGGVLDWDVDNDIRSGGNLDLYVTSQVKAVDWAAVRIAIDYILTVDNVPHEYPMGIYIPSAPKRDISSTDEVIDLEFYDKTIILSQDCIPSTKAFASGSLKTDALRWAISSTGEVAYDIHPSTAKFTKHTVFAAGTSKLEIVSTVLDSMGWFAIYCDRNGRFQCQPYALPSARPVFYNFYEGDASIHKADWTLDHDGFEVPNRVVVIGATNSKNKTLTAYAEDATSRWGLSARGRWITKVETYADLDKQKDVQAKADELLKTDQDVHDSIELSHAWLPVDMNDVVRFSSQGYSGMFAFRKSSVTLTPGALVESTLEGVTA